MLRVLDVVEDGFRRLEYMECIKTKGNNPNLIGTRKSCKNDRWCFAYEERGTKGYYCDGETKEAANQDTSKNLKNGTKVVWIKVIFYQKMSDVKIKLLIKIYWSILLETCSDDIK